MDTTAYPHQISKRGPGRPRESAPFRAADEALLRRAADALVQQDASNLTAFLRDHAVTLEKDLARLRGRWREIGDTLLAEAASSDTARIRSCLNLLVSDVSRITSQAETRRSWHALFNEVRAELAAGSTDRLSHTLVLFKRELSPEAVGKRARELRPERPNRATGRSTGDLLFLCARLLDQQAIEAWNREGGLVDEHEQAAD